MTFRSSRFKTYTQILHDFPCRLCELEFTSPGAPEKHSSFDHHGVGNAKTVTTTTIHDETAHTVASIVTCSAALSAATARSLGRRVSMLGFPRTGTIIGNFEI